MFRDFETGLRFMRTLLAQREELQAIVDEARKPPSEITAAADEITAIHNVLGDLVVEWGEELLARAPSPPPAPPAAQSELLLAVGATQDQEKAEARDWIRAEDMGSLVVFWLKLQKDPAKFREVVSDVELDLMTRLASVALVDLELDLQAEGGRK